MSRSLKHRMNTADFDRGKLKSAANYFAALDNSQVVGIEIVRDDEISKLAQFRIKDVRVRRPSYVRCAKYALPRPTTCDPAPSSIRGLPTVRDAHARLACCRSRDA
jgi:hypothetical protein